MASSVIKFYPINLLNDLVYEGEAIDGDIHLEKIQEEFYDQDLWSTYIRYIFKDVNTGKYYTVIHMQGSPEYPDDSDFYTLKSSDGTMDFCTLKSSDGTKVGCSEVKPVDVTVTTITTTTKYELVLVD